MRCDIAAQAGIWIGLLAIPSTGSTSQLVISRLVVSLRCKGLEDLMLCMFREKIQVNGIKAQFRGIDGWHGKDLCMGLGVNAGDEGEW